MNTTYRDEITGLVWLKDDASTYTWENAITKCENSTAGSRSDWRLPTQKELRESAKAGRYAGIPEPSAYIDVLPRKKREILDGLAFAIAPPETPLYWVIMHQGWMPKGVIARWWMGRDDKLGCDANYALSGIKRTEHAAFVAVRVHHWGTIYALVGGKDRWHVVGQWGPWLY